MREPHIGLTAAESTSVPPGPPFRRGAPNVVVIVLDDLGFAQLGCYGSDLDTPNLDRLAERGLRFTNFHTTAVCSPTRACLLTGRNHHRVGMGMLPDLTLNFPGYTGEIPREAATLAQILRAEGYSTTAIGKWHLTPRDQRSNGPYHTWPTGVGFERYYGFLNGETNQWTPNLVRDQTHIEPPATPEEGYHLDADLADEAIRRLHQLRIDSADRPFFLWYATAAPHAPHQAPREWIERFAGRFDDGWDAWRERTLARQEELGIVPPGTELSARPPWVEAWDDIDPDRQRLYARMMEVYAAFVAHADHHIGRVLDEIDRLGEADNTIVVLISDNGCSAEGGPNGSWNQLRHYISDQPDDLEEELSHYEDLGGFRSSGHYPWGWALAGNTPFRRWKRYTFEGGVRDPMVMSWPAGIDDQGGVRTQYCHVIDVMPTLLDLLGLEMPVEVDGVAQMSVDGVSIRDTLADPASPDPRTEQYYELWGSRAIYADGWKAVTNHVNQLTAAERDNLEGSHDFADDVWHLFDTTVDPTESTDLAGRHPDKVTELVERWHAAAERNNVLPIDDGLINRLAHMRLRWASWRGTHRFDPGDKVHENSGPMLGGAFRMTALFPDGLEAGASGVLCEQGDWIAGWAWYLRDGAATWIYDVAGARGRVDGTVPPDARSLVLEATPRDGGGQDLTLSADGDVIGRSAIEGTMTGAISPDGSFLTVGYGRPFPVTDEYEPPAPAPAGFAGVRIDLGPQDPLDLRGEFERVMRHQ